MNLNTNENGENGQRTLTRQLADRVDINQILQSNSFLRSDLGDFVNMPGMPQMINIGDQQTVLNIANPDGTNGDEVHQHLHQHGVPVDTIDGIEQPPGPHSLLPDLIKSMASTLPFILIFVAKIFHQHLLGFFIVLGFLTTLHWSNRSLVTQVELKDKKQNYKLVLLILFLLLNIAVFFYIFSDYKLQNCLIFMATNIQKMDTWNLIWIVVCSDTIIKFMIICVKSIITLLPFTVMPLRRRGSYYSTIEAFALFYRCLTPIHPWILFLLYSHISVGVEISDKAVNSNDETTPSIAATQTWSGFSLLLCILYCIFKLNQFFTRFSELKESVKELASDTSYGTPVSMSDIQDNQCPICQDKFSNPIALKCKHIFCQDCVCSWLDKENSCPMCRAKVSIKKPKFRDGSTTILIQWY